MAIELSWMDDERTVVRRAFSGSFTLDEYRTIVENTYAMIEEVFHAVDIVCDLSAARHLPSSLAPLTHRPTMS